MGASSGDPDPEPRPGADPGSPAIDVVVLDEQDDVVVDVERWAALATAVLAAEGVGDTEVTITFVDEHTIAELKRDHFGEHRPTDVLSFPLDEPALAGVEPTDGAPHLLGDVVICPTVAVRQAPAHAGSVDDELALLLVHGLLHLLGHDHAEADERHAMQARERALLASFHGPLGRDPWAGGSRGAADAEVVAGAAAPSEGL